MEGFKTRPPLKTSAKVQIMAMLDQSCDQSRKTLKLKSHLNPKI